MCLLRQNSALANCATIPLETGELCLLDEDLCRWPASLIKRLRVGLEPKRQQCKLNQPLSASSTSVIVLQRSIVIIIMIMLVANAARRAINIRSSFCADPTRHAAEIGTRRAVAISDHHEMRLDRCGMRAPATPPGSRNRALPRTRFLLALPRERKWSINSAAQLC